MNINLPDVNWQGHKWTIPGQVKKNGEEYSEVAEAVALDNPIETIREALDVMQTCDTLISMVSAEYHLSLKRFEREHVDKLRAKGYLKEGEYDRL